MTSHFGSAIVLTILGSIVQLPFNDSLFKRIPIHIILMLREAVTRVTWTADSAFNRLLTELNVLLRRLIPIRL